MLKVLPVFRSSGSISKSILTCEKKGISADNEPQSIIDLALKAGLKKVLLVDESMINFVQFYQNAREAGLIPIFGINLTIHSDINDKSEESFEKESKIVILIKNNDGYQKLIKIYTEAATNGFYYIPRIDWKTLKSLWCEKSLQLVIPYYDSFLFNNALRFSNCVPDFSFSKPIFWQEDNNLPFEYLIDNRLKEYTKTNNYPIVAAKSIYYNNREDFKAYLTYRCISKRATLNKPNFEHLSSAEFCFEAWKEQNAKI